MKKIFDAVKRTITKIGEKSRYFHHKKEIHHRPYDYMYDMYYDEFDDASEEDIKIYLAQTSLGR